MKCVSLNEIGWSADYVDIVSFRDGLNFVINFSLSGAKGSIGELYPNVEYKESDFIKLINKTKRVV